MAFAQHCTGISTLGPEGLDETASPVHKTISKAAVILDIGLVAGYLLLSALKDGIGPTWRAWQVG